MTLREKILGFLAAVGTILLSIFAFVTLRGRLSKKEVDRQRKDEEETHQRELDSLNREKKLEAEVVNFKFDDQADDIKEDFEKKVANLQKEAENETPTDPDAIAAGLLKLSKR